MKLSNMTSLFVRKHRATSLFPSLYFLPNQLHSKSSSNAPQLEITVTLILIDSVSDQWIKQISFAASANIPMKQVGVNTTFLLAKTLRCSQ